VDGPRALAEALFMARRPVRSGRHPSFFANWLEQQASLPAVLAPAVVCMTVAVCLGARAAAAPAISNLTRECVQHFDAATDYFPDKVTVDDAANFTVTYHRSYKIVQVGRTDRSPVERYVLVQCGTPLPLRQAELAGAQIATVPIRSLYSGSPTHLSPLADLHRLDVLTGVSTRKFLIGDDDIVKRVSGGRVREFSPASVIDTELVVSQRPSLFMTAGSAGAELGVIRQAGIPVAANYDWLEASALGRAEWLKYMSLFVNEERTAQRLYDQIKARYRSVRARAAAIPDALKPTVMAGRGSRGEFVIAGGRSYVAGLIQDAGGRYVWADNTAAGTATVDLETQLERAGGADIWINGGGWPNLAAMVKEDPRYALFKAYRNGQVWVYERRATAEGVNDYWSRSASHPDLVLADLIEIFHPGLLPNHEFEWYRQVPTR
jgi:iron complex transport system substrate-binding protein